jgi:murein DD-endopeptidase MepM/ murein hydrolase activator NlpD
LTAIGYHSTGDDAIALRALGSQGNEGAFARLAHRVFGGRTHGLRYYLLAGGDGPATQALDIGAAAGTDVYAPVDGTVVGLTAYVVNGRQYGSRIDIEPSAAPSLVLSLTHLKPDKFLTVGSTVTSGVSKVGTIVDFSHVEKQALARYTQDGGNHVELQVHPATALTSP